jgi:DNA-binding NtrC family response regulator
MPRLLVIDDDLASCRLVTAIFTAEGLSVVSANDGETGIAKAAAKGGADDGGGGGGPIDVVLLDMHLPDTDGLTLLESIGASAPSLPIIMLTADREVKSAIRATRLGAFDYLTKPIDHDEVVSVVRRALETHALRKEVEDLRRQVSDGGGGLAVQMGSSTRARDVIDQVRTVASSQFTALVLGETGTGKELVAQAIHRQSDRREQAFIALDCGAIPAQLIESELFGHARGAFTGADRARTGRFQLAQGGTLFLDEVGNLPMSLQVKLLRVLESKQMLAVGATKATALDVRFVAATNDDLQARVAEGLFRADLYFRLAQYTISLPALRDRPTDIAYLAKRFIEEASIELRRPVGTIAPDAMELLERHTWPGNVRELRNVVRQAVLRTKDLGGIKKELFRTILGKQLKDSLHPMAGGGGSNKRKSTTATAASSDQSLREIADEAARNAERQAIIEMLGATRGNKSQAARALRTDYKTLHLKMKSLGIRGRDYQP